MLADVSAGPRPASAEPGPAAIHTLGGYDRPWLHGALALGLVSLLLFTALAIARHQAFQSGRQDLEIYLQVLWNTAQGRPFATTLLKSNELHLAEHLALALLPLAPLYGLLPNPSLLLALQQIGLALAGLPLWLVARGRLGARAALLLLAGFYLMPSLAGTALDDFHPVALTAAPLAGAAGLLLIGRWRGGVMLALAAVLLEEEAALVVSGLGLWLLLSGVRVPGSGFQVPGPDEANLGPGPRTPDPGPRRWLAAGLLAAGAGLLLVATLLVMPGFHQPATLVAVGGNRGLGHFAELRRDPTVAGRRLIADRGLDGLVSFILPTGGTALLAPWLLAVDLPTALALLLQDRSDTFHRHWSAPILPLIWLAAAVGLSRLPAGSRRRLAGLGAVAVGSGLAYILASPLPGGGAFDPAGLARGPHEADLERAVGAVPPSAALAASSNAAAHLANRFSVYLYPIDDHYLSQLRYEQRPIDTYVLDLQEPDTQRVPPFGRNSPLLADPPYVIWSSGHKVMLLTRQTPSPRTASGVVFNRRMVLLGYDLERSNASLRATLYWQKSRDIFADFDRLAELVDSNGSVVARDKNLPLTSLFTTEKWKVGQVVVDRLELSASGDGPLTLRLAWLNHDRNTPLLVDGGGEALEIPVPNVD